MEVNPISVAKAFYDKIKEEFPEFESSESKISKQEEEIANLLFLKFAKISVNYEYVEESFNDFGLSQPGSESVSSEEALVDEKENISAEYVPVKKKAKILEEIEKHPKWKINTIRQRFGSFKFMSYLPRWKEQIKNGGTSKEAFYEIDTHTFKQFQEARQNGQPVHDADIKRWALQRATDFKSVRTTFSASDTWIMSFKRRHGITSRKITKLVSKKEKIKEEEVLKSAEDFRKSVLSLRPHYELNEIWNTDQIGFQYEYVSERTLSFKGEKYTFGTAFSPKNRMTHSYTVQYIISAAGEIIGDAFICLQEPNGRLGEIVLKNIFVAPNLTITCSKSGKLTSSHVSYFVKKVIKPALQDTSKVLYILDSWTGHVNQKIYSEVLQEEDGNFSLKIIPPHCTPLVQPLDVYFNLQLKYLIKRFFDHANLLNMQITSRNDSLKLQSCAHFLLNAPVFKPMIKYCFIKTGIVEEDRTYFKNVKEACFSFKDKECVKSDCKNIVFITCTWCEKVFCFDHFYMDYHVNECSKGSYLK